MSLSNEGYNTSNIEKKFTSSNNEYVVLVLESEVARCRLGDLLRISRKRNGWLGKRIQCTLEGWERVCLDFKQDGNAMRASNHQAEEVDY